MKFPHLEKLKKICFGFLGLLRYNLGYNSSPLVKAEGHNIMRIVTLKNFTCKVHNQPTKSCNFIIFVNSINLWRYRPNIEGWGRIWNSFRLLKSQVFTNLKTFQPNSYSFIIVLTEKFYSEMQMINKLFCIFNSKLIGKLFCNYFL